MLNLYFLLALQETQAVQNEELARIRPTDFVDGLSIISEDGHLYKLKHMCAVRL